MREEIKQELQRRIAEKFEAGLRNTVVRKPVSEEERQKKAALFADLLFQSALRQIGD
jgi:hypothetical protein